MGLRLIVWRGVMHYGSIWLVVVKSRNHLKSHPFISGSFLYAFVDHAPIITRPLTIGKSMSQPYRPTLYLVNMELLRITGFYFVEWGEGHSSEVERRWWRMMSQPNIASVVADDRLIERSKYYCKSEVCNPQCRGIDIMLMNNAALYHSVLVVLFISVNYAGSVHF